MLSERPKADHRHGRGDARQRRDRPWAKAIWPSSRRKVFQSIVDLCSAAGHGQGRVRHRGAGARSAFALRLLVACRAPPGTSSPPSRSRLQDAKGKSLGSSRSMTFSAGPKADRNPHLRLGRLLRCQRNSSCANWTCSRASASPNTRCARSRPISCALPGCWKEAGRRGIEVGVDMCQNLADPPQAVDDVVGFVEAVHA